jgi:hypothetical protein
MKPNPLGAGELRLPGACLGPMTRGGQYGGRAAAAACCRLAPSRGPRR